MGWLNPKLRFCTDKYVTCNAIPSSHISSQFTQPCLDSDQSGSFTQTITVARLENCTIKIATQTTVDIATHSYSTPSATKVVSCTKG